MRFEATRGCGRVSHVFSGLISMFLFDFLRTSSGCIAPTCTPLATAWYRHFSRNHSSCSLMHMLNELFRSVSESELTDVISEVVLTLYRTFNLYSLLN